MKNALALIIVIALVVSVSGCVQEQVVPSGQTGSQPACSPVVVLQANQAITSETDVQTLFNQFNNTIWTNTQTATCFPFNIFWVQPGFQYANITSTSSLVIQKNNTPTKTNIYNNTTNMFITIITWQVIPLIPSIKIRREP